MLINGLSEVSTKYKNGIKNVSRCFNIMTTYNCICKEKVYTKKKHSITTDIYWINRQESRKKMFFPLFLKDSLTENDTEVANFSLTFNYFHLFFFFSKK